MHTFYLNNKSHGFFLLLSIVIIFISGCDDSSCPTSPYGDSTKHNIYGSGNITTEERTVPFFNSIHHATVGQVNITYGNTHQVTVITDDNIQKYVKTEVKGEELFIYIESDSGLSNFKLTINIKVTDIKSITTSSAGNIKSTNTLISDKLAVNILSAGNISLDIETKELHSNLFSAGNLFLTGKTVNHYSGLFSAGNLQAFNFKTDTTIISINSAGNAFVNVSDLLDATLTSAGSLYYKGHPQIISRVHSIGNIVNSN